jgi:hypothetical protein
MVTNMGGLVSETLLGYEVLKDLVGLTRWDGVVAANQRQVRIGDLLAFDSGTSKFMVRRSTTLAVQGVNTDHTITVADAHPFSAGGKITVTGESEDTIVSVDYTLNTIVLTNGLTNTRAVGVVAYDANANRAVAIGIHIAPIIYSKAYDQGIAPAVTGHFKYSKVRGITAAGVTELKGVYHAAWDTLTLV